MHHALGDVSNEIFALAALCRQGQDVSAQELRAQPPPAPGPMPGQLLTLCRLENAQSLLTRLPQPEPQVAVADLHPVWMLWDRIQVLKSCILLFQNLELVLI